MAILLALADGPSPIRRVETAEPVVALTFDACATRAKSYSFDRRVYEILKAEQVPATLFVSGRWVERHPDVARELAADPLVEFGDHSYSHPRMTELPRWKIAREIDRTEAALEKIGERGVAFRPPAGAWSRRVVRIAESRKLPTVLWDVVSGDPIARRADSIVRAVVRRARPGSIVIFHINDRRVKKTGKRTRTAQALPTILRELRAKGLRFVHVSELLALGQKRDAAVAHTAPAR